MGLFNKAQPPAPTPSAPVASPQGPLQQGPAPRADRGATVIARQARVKGEITGSGEFLIEGRLEGDVRCQGTVTVVEGGVVKGNLHGSSVRVAGAVEGDVSAEERVELTPSARLAGNITAPRMHIAEGATFEGQVFMRKPGKGGAGNGGSGSGTGKKDGPAARGERPGRKGGA